MAALLIPFRFCYDQRNLIYYASFLLQRIRMVGWFKTESILHAVQSVWYSNQKIVPSVCI